MSKISIVSATLCASSNMNSLLEELKTKDPATAKYMESLKPEDINSLIEECIKNALQTVKAQGIQVTDHIEDFYHNKVRSYEGLKIIGALKTAKLSGGLGVMMDNGVIKFAGDEYKSEWREEIARLKKIFTDAYLLEVAKSALIIMNYDVQTPETYERGDDDQSFNLIATKTGV